jgi:hypothetical protein
MLYILTFSINLILKTLMLACSIPSQNRFFYMIFAYFLHHIVSYLIEKIILLN